MAGKTVIADMPGGYVACCVSDIRSLYVIYNKSEKTITWDDLGPSVPLNLVTDPLSKEGASWYNVSVSDLNDAAKLLNLEPVYKTPKQYEDAYIENKT